MSAPRGHWLLGHLPAIRADPLGLLDRCQPPNAVLWLGRAAHLLLEPADIIHVLSLGSDRYTKGKAFRHGRRLYGNSLLVSEGADHRDQVRVIGGLFFRNAALLCVTTFCTFLREFSPPTASIVLKAVGTAAVNFRVQKFEEGSFRFCR